MKVYYTTDIEVFQYIIINTKQLGITGNLFPNMSLNAWPLGSYLNGVKSISLTRLTEDLEIVGPYEILGKQTVMFFQQERGETTL